jgi:hypothetical protein
MNTPVNIRLARLTQISKLFDSIITIPGTKIQIGLDSIIGLIPGIGDAIGTAVSSYVVYEAARLGLPTSAIFRMVLNVALDSFIGAIPFLGDLFDVAWKANLKNVAIIEEYLGRHDLKERTDKSALRMIQLMLVALVVIMASITYFLVKLLIQGLFG